MAIGYAGLPKLTPVKGFRLATVAAGIKYADRNDMVLIELPKNAQCAGVFTRNAFCAAPVEISKNHLADNTPRYWLINAGNANAGTGQQGIDDALACCGAVAQTAGCEQTEVLPFSTGVIGENLPTEKMINAVPELFDALSETAWENAAKGIMTTDTVAKGGSLQVDIAGKTVTLTGIAKGSGMICPNMATMLAFIATDAAIESDALKHALQVAVSRSFNRITVDGDTSTNDACVLAASGMAGNPVIDQLNSDEYLAFETALTELCQSLAQLIIRDGEGATKFITVEVSQGINEFECEEVAYTIAHSPLVKTAFFAGDPNWGRILAAVGRANVVGLNLDHVSIYLNDVCIVHNGARAEDYTEERGQMVMSQEEISIRVMLGRGEMSATVWTCDLSYDYVKINAEYRS